MMNDENNLSGLNGLKIISMNCDSLNLSTTKRDGSLTKFNEKIETILSNGADISLLQDIRAKESDFRIIENYIRCSSRGNYKIVINSNNSKRGVAILYKEKLNIIIDDVYKPPCHNILLVNAIINECRLMIGSIYGETDRDDELFFDKLKDKLTDFRNETFIVGGDMNAIISLDPPQIVQNDGNLVHSSRLKYNNCNLELLNTANIPNPKHIPRKLSNIYLTVSG